jgi:hypothetical protein
VDTLELVAVVAIGGGLLYVIRKRASTTVVSSGAGSASARVIPPSVAPALQWKGDGGWQAKVGGFFEGLAFSAASAVPGGGVVAKAAATGVPAIVRAVTKKIGNPPDVVKDGTNAIKEGAAVATHALSKIGSFF